MKEFVKARDSMVKNQIMARGLKDPKVIEAFQSIPREYFVLENAYITEGDNFTLIGITYYYFDLVGENKVQGITCNDLFVRGSCEWDEWDEFEAFREED